jgi:hypothetical protein
MKLSIVGKAMTRGIQGLNGEAVSTGGAEIGTEESLWHSNIAEEPHLHSSTPTHNFLIPRRLCHTRVSPTDSPYYFQCADEGTYNTRAPLCEHCMVNFCRKSGPKNCGVKLYLDFPIIRPILCAEFKLKNRINFLPKVI